MKVKIMNLNRLPQRTNPKTRKVYEIFLYKGKTVRYTTQIAKTNRLPVLTC